MKGNSYSEKNSDPRYSALLIVDVQVDMCEGGVLGVKDTDTMIDTINQIRSCKRTDYEILSCDWHPINHISFYENHLSYRDAKPYTSIYLSTKQRLERFGTIHNGAICIDNSTRQANSTNHSSNDMRNPDDEKCTVELWPTHCVEYSIGAAFAASLQRNKYEIVIRKGTKSYAETYSVFGNDEENTNIIPILQSKNIKKIYIVGIALEKCIFYSACDAAKNGYECYVIIDTCRAMNVENIEIYMKRLIDRGVKIISSREFLS